MARMLNPVGERFRGNLRQLSTSQTSIETLSKYAQFHGDDAQALVDVWWDEFSRADPSRCLAFVYLLSDIAHAFKGTHNPFILRFEPRLAAVVEHILSRCDLDAQSRVVRTLRVWQQRLIFDPTLVQRLLKRFGSKSNPPVNPEENILEKTNLKVKSSENKKLSLIEALQQHDHEALHDVLTAAGAAPYLSNPSMQGLNSIHAQEVRLEARRGRIQQLVAMLTERLNSEKTALAACLSDLAVCRSKMEQCSREPDSNKRVRTV